MDRSKIIVRSDKSELIRFKKSILAKDIRREILVWCRENKNKYPGTETMLEKGRIDGRLEAMVYILGIIDVMIMTKEDSENDSRRNKAD